MRLHFLATLPSLLFLQVGGTGDPPVTHCWGCDNDVSPPAFYDQNGGSCVSFTTAQVTIGRDGDCVWTGIDCEPNPCTPEVTLYNHQEDDAQGGTVKGTIGDITFGPIKFAGGESVEIFRSGTILACNATSPYMFEVTGTCPGGTDTVELVIGWFNCSACEGG